MYLEKVKNTAPKVPELAMRVILKAIADGRIKLNEDLIAERELAAALGIGRSSLRECLAILEFVGVIESRANRKVVVKPADYIQNTISLIRLSETPDTLSDFIEFRRVNESAIAELACERATEEDLTVLRECVERMEQNPDDPASDIEFHLALAEASHNAMFAANIRLLNSMIYSLRYRFSARRNFLEKTMTAHRTIFEAVARRDKSAARTAMLNHLKTIELYTEEENAPDEG